MKSKFSTYNINFMSSYPSHIFSMIQNMSKRLINLSSSSSFSHMRMDIFLLTYKHENGRSNEWMDETASSKCGTFFSTSPLYFYFSLLWWTQAASNLITYQIDGSVDEDIMEKLYWIPFEVMGTSNLNKCWIFLKRNCSFFYIYL